MPLPPPGKFWISGLLRLFLVYSWGEIAKAGPTAKPGRCVCRIKGVTPFQATEAAKQLVIRIKRGKISVLILIGYRHP